MLLDERYVTLEDAARQIKVQPITLRRWLAIGTMPHVTCEGMEYVLQADVDAFNEACQCRNQLSAAEWQRRKTVASVG
jgi:predicted site-specific integrase-resolvase